MNKQEQRAEVERIISSYEGIAINTERQIKLSFVLDILRDLKQELLYNLDLDTINNTFICMGRLSREKGIDILIDALIILENSKEALVEDIKVIIAGNSKEPSYEKELKERAAKLTKIKVEFVGLVQGKEKERFLEQEAIFIQPSTSEVASIAAREALLYRHPVILSNTASGKDIFRDCDRVFGKLVDFDEPEKRAYNLAEAIKEARTWDYYKMGDEAFSEAKEKYDIDKIADKYLEVYNED